MVAPVPLIRSQAQYDLHDPQPSPQSPDSPATGEDIVTLNALLLENQAFRPQNISLLNKIRQVFACAIL